MYTLFTWEFLPPKIAFVMRRKNPDVSLQKTCGKSFRWVWMLTSYPIGWLCCKPLIAQTATWVIEPLPERSHKNQPVADPLWVAFGSFGLSQSDTGRRLLRRPGAKLISTLTVFTPNHPNIHKRVLCEVWPLVHCFGRGGLIMSAIYSRPTSLGLEP